MSQKKHTVLSQFTLKTSDQTTQFANAISPLLGAGDLVLLEGPIGAGKTHFARSVIQSKLAVHGVFEDVPSPTFTLVQTYDAGGLEIWHSDLYRLTSPSELDELGLFDAFETALVIVEWPERLGEDPPPRALSLQFEMRDDLEERDVTLLGDPSIWTARLATLINNEFSDE